MEHGEHTRQALVTAADLVNTGPQTCGQEQLADLVALRAFFDRHPMGETVPLTLSDLASVHVLRTQVYEVFRSAAPRRTAHLINSILMTARATPRLVSDNGTNWRVCHRASTATPSDCLAVDCGIALALALEAGDIDRLDVCQAPDCARVLVDLSRNRSRRYCDLRTCGNRLHVAAYRTRRKMGKRPDRSP